MKPIQTHYKGYHFRSRLEARWAVFFDALGIKWEYELEGYHLDGVGKYLPDFFLEWPDGRERGPEWASAGYWVEIKATQPTEGEFAKCKALAIESGHSVLLMVGQPLDDTEHYFGRRGNYYRASVRPFTFSGWTRWELDRDVLNRAAVAARSARFEHGQSGV